MVAVVNVERTDSAEPPPEMGINGMGARGLFLVAIFVHMIRATVPHIQHLGCAGVAFAFKYTGTYAGAFRIPQVLPVVTDLSVSYARTREE